MTTSLWRGAAVAVAAFAFVGPTIAEETKPAQRPCPFVRSIDNFTAVDDRTAIIETSPSRKYLVKFTNTCREMKWAQFARVEARPGICLSTGDIIVFGDRNFSDRCWISSITQLPPQGAQSPASY